VHASLGADDDLLRVVAALRKERSAIAIHVRADAGFGLPKMYAVCEHNGLTYTFGFATNARLKKFPEDLMTQGSTSRRAGEIPRLDTPYAPPSAPSAIQKEP
jgi:hypothetical protein